MQGRKQRPSDFGTPADGGDGRKKFKKKVIPDVSKELEEAQELVQDNDRGGRCGCW